MRTLPANPDDDLALSEVGESNSTHSLSSAPPAGGVTRHMLAPRPYARTVLALSGSMQVLAERPHPRSRSRRYSEIP